MNRRAPKRPRRRAHDCVVMSTDELVARVGSFIREFSVLRALAATSKAGQRAAGAEALRRVLLRRPSAAAILAPTAYTGDPIAMAHTSAPIAALRAFGGRGPRRLPSRTPRFEIGAYTLLVDVYFKDMQTNSWRTIFSTATTLQELFSADMTEDAIRGDLACTNTPQWHTAGPWPLGDLEFRAADDVDDVEDLVDAVSSRLRVRAAIWRSADRRLAPLLGDDADGDADDWCDDRVFAWCGAEATDTEADFEDHTWDFYFGSTHGDDQGTFHFGCSVIFDETVLADGRIALAPRSGEGRRRCVRCGFYECDSPDEPTFSRLLFRLEDLVGKYEPLP